MKKRTMIAVLAMLFALILAVGVGCSLHGTIEKYTVRFMNGTETFLEEDYALGESVRFPAQDPTKAADATFSYTFLGWNYSGMEEDTLITEHVVHGPQTFFAVYKRTPRDTGEPTKYRVTFRDSITNEPIGEPQDVEEGASAVLPDPPLHNGFHFVRWSVSHEHIYARTEIEAIYERNQYTLKQHYLGEDHEKRVEYEARFGGEPAGVDSIFKFEGWFWDTEYRIPVDPEDTMPADNCEIYGKYDLDFSRVELVPSGELVYGGGDDYVRVAGLSQIDGLVYTYHWQDGTIDPELELMHAGTFRIEVEVTGNYRNGLLTADTKVVETFTVQKAALEVKVTIPAASRTIVYGDGEPEKNISYEGFQYNDSDALVSLSYDYHAVTRARASAPVYSTRAGEVHLDAGSYMMETKVETLRDYEVEEIPEVEFTVTRRPLKVSLAIESFTYGDPFAPQLSFDSFVYGDTMETALGMPTYTFGGSAYAGGLVDAGSYEATVSGFAVKNYEIEYPAAATPFTVAKKDLSLTVTAQGSTYGVRPTYAHAFVGVVEGDLANFGIKDYTLTKGGQPYDPMGAEGEKPFGAGQYTVTVKKEDVTDTRAFKNYNLTAIGTADFTVKKAQLRIGLSVDARYTYGDTVTPQPVFETFCYNDSAASLRGSGKLTYTRNGEQDNYGYRRAGSYTVDISGYTSENYEISYETASFVVDPAPLKLTVQLQKTALKYGETPAVKVGEDLTGGILYEGFKHSDTVSSVFGSKAPVVQYLSAAQGTVEKFHVGSYTAFCTPEEGLAPNYTITVVTQDFSVSPRTLFVGIEFETETSLVYGNKPQAHIIYAKEGYDGFLEGEETLAQAAYIKYTGAASYTQAQLGGAAKMVVGSYTLSVEGMPELSDYTLTYQKDGLGFEITKKALQVTLTEGNKSYTYGDKPVVDIQFEGFAYDESAAALFGEKASTLSYFKDGASAHYAPKTYFEAGSYTATLEGLENENYTISVQGAAFTVEKKLLTVTAAEAGYTYGDPRPEPTLSYDGFVPNEDRSVLTGTPSYTYKHETTDCTAQEYFDVGSYTVSVKGYTSSNYTIEYVDGTFTVAKRDAVVTVSAQGATYGTAPTLSYAAPRILARDMAGFAFAYAYTFSRTASGQKNDYTPLSFAYYQAGNYTVTLKYTANENYTLTVQSADFAIAKKPLTVGLKGVESSYVYGTVPAPALTFSGFVGEENEEVFTAKPYTQFTYYNSDSRSTSVRNFPVGSYFVGATSGYAADNYAVTYAEKTAFAVTKAPLTVTVNVADITYGATPAPTVTYSKFAFSDSATSLTGRVQYTYTLGGETKQGTLHAGSYTVSASGLSSPNYEITYVSHGLTVAKKALKVSVSVADFTYGAQPAPVLGYEGFIRGESENNLTGSLVYTYSGEKNAKNFLRAGQHTLTLSGYASGDYAITYGTASFNVAKKAITVEVTEQNDFASFTYDGSRKLVLTSTAQGLVEGDTQEGLGTLAYVLSGTHYASADVSGVLHADRYTFTAQGYTSNDYVISYVYGSGKASAVSFTVSPAEVKLTLKEGWTVYGDDTAGEWYTVEGSIYNGELTFGTAIEKDNAPYDGKDTYFPHGTYKVTVSYKVNPDYRVTAKGAELSGSTSVSFTVAKKSIEIASGGTQPWAKRGDWSYAPKLEDSRFTLTGTIVLKNAESLEAQEYRANSVGEVFDWKDAYKITLADGTDVTENFTVTYSFNLMLSNSSFSIEKPEAVFTYDSKAHTFKITATAEGIEAQEIKIQYKTEEAGEYGDALPQFTNAGSYTVWYKVTAPNCDPDEGSFAVTGNKATPNLAAFADTNTYTYNKGTFLDAQTVRSALVKGNVYEDAKVEFSLTGAEFHTAFPEIKNAGRYTITLKVSGDNYIEKTADYTLTVQKATVEAPEIAHKTYNKEQQTAEVAEDALYTVRTNEGGTAAGEYDVVLALSDASNYRWASDAEGTQETLKLTFTIDKAILNMDGVKWDYEAGSFTYDLQPHAVALTGLPEDGNIEVTYQSEEGTQAGEYHAVATLTYDSANYNDIQTEWKLTWNIAKADYDLQGVTDETGYIYTGAAQGRTLEELTGLIKALGEDGFKVNFSGEHQFTNANEEGYTVKYTVTGNENYNDVTDGSYQVKIGKAQAAIDTSAIVFGELAGEENAYRATYNGKAYTVDWAAAKPQDDFHGTLTAEMIRADGESSFTNFKEGGYTVTLTIDGTSNYEGATLTFTITIEKAEYVVTEPIEKEFTYNGKLQGGEVEVKVFGSDGFTMNYGEGGHQFKNANEAGYTVTYTVSGNENYNDKSGSYSVKIMKAEYVVTEPSENTFTYNGTLQGKAVTAAGVIENDTLGEISYEGGNQRTDANEDGYTITYTVAGNENYNEHSGTYTLTIMKAEASLDLSGITTEFTYTGEAQSVALDRAKAASAVEGATGYGVITFEKDGASIEEFKFTDVDEGNDVTITVKLSEGTNFHAAEQQLTLTVKKAQAVIDTSAIEFGELKGEGNNYSATYKAAAYTVDWAAAKSNFGTVENDAAEIKNAATYTVTLSVEGTSNYESATLTYTITIEKAKASIDTDEVEKQYTYSGAEQTVEGAKAVGIEGDTEGLGEIGYSNNTFTNVPVGGKQTVKITLSEGTNYLGATAEVEITIEKATLTVTSAGYDGFYDGQEHSGSVTVAGLQGSDTAERVYSIQNVTRKDVCNESVHFTVQLVSNNYVFANAEENGNFGGDYNIIITPVSLAVTDKKANETYTGSAFEYDTFFTVEGAVNGESGEAVYTVSVSSKLHYYSTIEGADEYTITITANKNYAFEGDSDAMVTFTIAKKTLDESEVELPAIEAQINKYGKTLSDVEIGDAHFQWKEAGTELVIGLNAYDAVYNPDKDNYNDYDCTITFKTVKNKVTVAMQTKSTESNFGTENITLDFTATYEDGMALDEEARTLIKFAISGVNFTIGSTYLAIATFTIDENKYFELTGTTSFDNILVKIKSVWIGSGSIGEYTDQELYTIEEALNKATSGEIVVVEYNTSFAPQEVARTAGYDKLSNAYNVLGTLLIPYGKAAKGYKIGEGQSLSVSSATNRAEIGTVLQQAGNPDRKGGYATLKVPENIKLNVNGTITVNAILTAVDGALSYINGANYGELVIGNGVEITFNNNSIFNGIGFVTGDGTIKITDGATVNEPLNATGFKGFNATQGASVDSFPINQFTLSSIATEMSVAYGAKYNVLCYIVLTKSNMTGSWGVTTNFAGKPVTGKDKPPFMQMSEGSTVNKKVNPEDGKVEFTFNGDIQINNLDIASVDMLSIKLNLQTTGFQIPLAGHFKLEVQSGTLMIPEGVELKLLPGATVIVKQGATLDVKGAIYSYGKNVVFPEGYDQFEDGKNYPVTGVGGTAEVYKTNVILGYTATTPVVFRVEGTLKAETGSELGVEILGAEGATIEVSSSSLRHVTITEDDTTSTNPHPYTVEFSSRGINQDASSTPFAKGTWHYTDGNWKGDYYQIVYNANGGELKGEDSDLYNLEALEKDTIQTENPERAYHTFAGWYYDQNCTQEVGVYSHAIPNAGEVITVYAKWDEIEYTIKFNVAYLSEFNQTSIVIPEAITWSYSKLVSFNDPTWDRDAVADLVFSGWYSNSNFMDSVTGISKENIDLFMTEGTTITVYGYFKLDNEFAVLFMDEAELYETEDAAQHKQNLLYEHSSLQTNLVGEKGKDVPGIADATKILKGIDDNQREFYFGGWYVSVNGEEIMIDESTPIPEKYLTEGNLVLHAKWIQKAQIKVTLWSNYSPEKTYAEIAVDGGSFEVQTKAKDYQYFYYYYPKDTSVKITIYVRDGNAGSSQPSGHLKVAGTTVDTINNVSQNNKSYTITMPDPANGIVDLELHGNGMSGLCLFEGTLVMLADGTQKKVEDLTYDDMLLVFNHTTGKYEASPMLNNAHVEDAPGWFRVIYLTFSDGTKIGVVTEHAFFDSDLNQYVYLGEDNAREFIGHKFVNTKFINGDFVTGEITLVDVEVVEKYGRRYSPIAYLQFSAIVEGLWGITEVVHSDYSVDHGYVNYFEFDENRIYDEAKMQTDIEKYGLYTYEDFADIITYEEFMKGPWKFFKVAVGKGQLSYEDIRFIITAIYESREKQGITA